MDYRVEDPGGLRNRGRRAKVQENGRRPARERASATNEGLNIVMISLTKAAGLGRWTGFAAGLALATALVAQTVNQQQPGDVPNSAAHLKNPADAQILGNAAPRTEEPRVGTEGVGRVRNRWAAYH